MKPRSAHRALTAVGAVLAGAGVALSAYAAHGAEGTARANLQSAALFALVHGVALAALSRQTPHRLGTAALSMLLIGVLLFSGSLVAAHFFGAPTRLAPAGGSLLILGWLLYAADAFRR
ncbi:MAG: DUF423 domain-containing protein [Xanthomonadales bacterium]|nr:DUF423 domain-containing protein [Xanthomonadales bacterium]